MRDPFLFHRERVTSIENSHMTPRIRILINKRCNENVLPRLDFAQINLSTLSTQERAASCLIRIATISITPSACHFDYAYIIRPADSSLDRSGDGDVAETIRNATRQPKEPIHSAGHRVINLALTRTLDSRTQTTSGTLNALE